MSQGFTTRELAAMKLPGYPGTPQGWDKLVKTRGWAYVESHGRGRGGVRREYIPAADVLALIEAVRRGEVAQAAPKVAPKMAEAPVAMYQALVVAPEINVPALAMILGGILQGMGQNIDPLKAATKAVEYYQEAVRDGLITSTGVGNGGAKAA